VKSEVSWGAAVLGEKRRKKRERDKKKKQRLGSGTAE